MVFTNRELMRCLIKIFKNEVITSEFIREADRTKGIIVIPKIITTRLLINSPIFKSLYTSIALLL
ncbi:hypothetical protein C5S32_09430 [ANME-1 cluster archaeon GoMg1]|nr:hypothetical protein [ANME-1 cluster archaeon GoMg1]